MKSINKLKLNQNSTIKEALKIIDNAAMQIALVIDKDNKLIGTLTDGDIRRGLLKGLDLNSSIETIINKNPLTAKITDTKEEILQKALAKKIRQIPIVDENGKIVDIEEIEELIKPKEKSNKVVLMVGGLGTRLRPLTETTPKPMLKVGNKPILQTIIEKFAQYGYKNFIMCVNYKSHIIEDYFKDGSEFGVNIEYVLEKKRMGTAGALSLLKEKPKEDFFVMNGDILTNVNFEHLHNYHVENNSIATMCVREYEYQVPFGVVNLKDNKIVSIEEKPTYKFFVSAGIYMLNPESLDYIPKNEFFDMPTLFDRIIKKDKKAISFPIREYWIDIGKIEEYKRANEEFKRYF
jgi:dTDP-glucose pyrophosphorylase/predicted transcriptional regulator